MEIKKIKNGDRAELSPDRKKVTLTLLKEFKSAFSEEKNFKNWEVWLLVGTTNNEIGGDARKSPPNRKRE